MTIEAVLFDLDNTLTHRDLSVQAFSRALFQHYQAKIAMPEQQALPLILETIRYIDNGGYPLKERMTVLSIGGSVADRLLQDLTWHQPPHLDELSDFWFSQFGLNAVKMPGAEILLQQLRDAGYRLALISNGGHATRLKILEGLGFADYFDLILSSERAGIAKPSAGIFEIACAELQIQPQQGLYIGDHPVNDYQGATHAGLHALLIAGFHSLDAHPNLPTQHVIHMLNEIPQHLKRLATA